MVVSTKMDVAEAGDTISLVDPLVDSLGDSVAETPSDTQSAKTEALLRDPIGRTLVKLSAPNIVAMLVMALTTIAEGVYAGMLGIPELAALAIVFPFVMLTQMLSAGAMGGAISASVARALGGRDLARAEKLVLHAVIIGLTAAFIFNILYFLIGAPLFQLLGASGETLVAAVEYGNIFFPGAILIWLCHSLLSVVRGTGNMLFPAVVLLGTSVTSALLSGAFALGWGPFPTLGMQGLALGMIVAFSIAIILTVTWMALGYAGLRLTNAFARPRADLFRDILHVGLLASLSAVQTVLTIVVMVGIVGTFGREALAGYGLGARLEFMTVPIVFGIGAAMTSMIGANMGAEQFERAKAIAWCGSIGAGIIVGTIGVVVSVFPDLWLGLFLTLDNVGTLEAGRKYLHFVAPFYFLFATGMALYFASQGAGKVLWPVIAGGLRMIIAIAGGFLATRVFGLGLESVFVAIAAGMTVYGIVTIYAVGKINWGSK